MKAFQFLFSVCLLTVCVSKSYGQCADVDFSIPSQICRDQNLFLAPAAGADQVTWDICVGDLNSVPSGQSFFHLPGAVGRPALQFLKEGDTWFGFVTGTWTNTLDVLEFGNGLAQVPTRILSHGNLNGELKNPGSISVIREGGIYYALIHNTASQEIVRITFASQFSEVSDVTILTSGIGYINSGFAVGRDPINGWIGVISEPDNTFTIIRLGIDLHPSTPDDLIKSPTVPNPNNLGDIDLINVCGEWFGAAVNMAGGNTYFLTFGQDLFSVPQIEQMTSLPVSNAGRLRFAREGEEYYLLVSSLDGLWHTLKFGTALNASPTVFNQGDLNGTIPSETYAVGLAKENSEWHILTIRQNNGEVYRVNYELTCPAISETSDDSPMVVKFQAPGTYTISMDALSGGNISVKSKTVTVTADLAPDLNLMSENICVANDVSFLPGNLSGDIATYSWDFGDMATSTEANPRHLYDDVGQYMVKLHVTAHNGCSNSASHIASIVPKPVADFSLPVSLICTNNQFTFSPLTEDIFAGNLSYKWYVDGSLESSERDLVHAFTSTGPKELKLITSIPGCSTEITKTISMVEAGPVVDFSFTGICADESFEFQEEVLEPVESYLWDFGNGQHSTEPNPQFVFQTSGDFMVSLTATNSAGCQIVKTKTITAQASPVVDFHLPGAPNACSGSSALFLNQSAQPDRTPITEWLWEFSDPLDGNIATDVHAQHTFTEAGIYQVSLTATTSTGCDATREKAVVIEGSPSTDFTFTPACDDEPMQFLGPVDEIVTWYWEVEGVYYANASPTHTFRAPGDYPVYLKVTGTNNCSSEITETVTVPMPLSPDFTVIKNCVEHEAIFTAITTDGDPIVLQEWDFSSGEHYTGSPVTHTFVEHGIEAISLKVTTAAGCSYQVNKIVNVLPSPAAAFSADPVGGAFPLEVNFTNNSTNATKYSWRFSDRPNETSTQISPVYTFTGAGAYEVTLKAFNDQQCEDSTSMLITTVDPLPDVDIEMITLTPNTDGSWKMIITLHNKGNTVLKDLPIDIDFQGTLVLRHTAHDRILPNSKYNVVFSTGILNVEDLRYVCASIELQGDRSMAGNRLCKEFENSFLLFPGYPNPTKGVLNLEWIAPTSSNVRISLIDAMGRRVFDNNSAGVPGFNQVTLELSALRDGVYYLLVDDGTSRNSQRILLSSQR